MENNYFDKVQESADILTDFVTALDEDGNLLHQLYERGFLMSMEYIKELAEDCKEEE